MKESGIKYYRYEGHKGIRYFRVNWDQQKVAQNVVHQDGKRGRPNMKGVYEISWMTWQSNYCHYTTWESIKETTEKLWNYWKGETLKLIRA